MYVKGPADLPILAWSVVFFSLLRLLLTHHAFPALAHYYGIRKPGKVSRFGEQGYAVVYFAVMGAWGSVSLFPLPPLSKFEALMRRGSLFSPQGAITLIKH